MTYIKWVDKYRPTRYDEVVGQKNINKLKKDAETDSYYSVYIFSGQFGSGKTSTARILAADVNSKIEDEGWDGALVKGILNGDDRTGTVQEINASENSRVDTARTLIESLNFSRIGRPVIILDECQNMTSQAMDTLLKTLENPPNDTIFILVTTDVNSIPATVVSRAKQIEFVAVKDEPIREQLQYIAKEEGFDLEDAKVASAIEQAVFKSDGSVRNSVKEAEQLLGMSQDSEEEFSSVELVGEIIKSLDSKYVPDILIDVAKALDYVSPVTIMRGVYNALTGAITGKSTQFSEWSIDDKIWAVNSISDTIKDLQTSGSQRIALETGLITAVNPPQDQVRRLIQEVIKQLPEVKIIVENNGGAVNTDWPVIAESQPEESKEIQEKEKAPAPEQEEDPRVDGILDEMFEPQTEEVEEITEVAVVEVAPVYGNDTVAEKVVADLTKEISGKRAFAAAFRRHSKSADYFNFNWESNASKQEELDVAEVEGKGKTLVVTLSPELVDYLKVAKPEVSDVMKLTDDFYMDNFGDNPVVFSGDDFLAVLY